MMDQKLSEKIDEFYEKNRKLVDSWAVDNERNDVVLVFTYKELDDQQKATLKLPEEEFKNLQYEFYKIEVLFEEGIPNLNQLLSK